MGTTTETSSSVTPSHLNLSIVHEISIQNFRPLPSNASKKPSARRRSKITEDDLVSNYFNELISFLKKKRVPHDVLDDVVQETWLVVLQKLRNNEIRHLEKVESFIFSVASNQLIMFYRKNQKIRGEAICQEPMEPRTHEPDRLMEAKQLGERIARAIERLNQFRDRDILTRTFLSNSTKTEIAKAHHLSMVHFDRVKYRSRMRFIDAWNAS